MTIPTAYADENALADYMLVVLSDVGKDLEITRNIDVAEQINDTLLAYGATDVSTISGAENIAKLRALARVYAWRLAMTRAAARYDFSDGTQSLKRSQYFPMIRAALALAESDADALGVGTAPVVKVSSATYIDDPYRAVGV